MTRKRSRSRKNGGNTPNITDEQFMELLGRVAPGAKALGPVRRLSARGQRETFSVPVLVDEAQMNAQSLREGRKIVASLSRVERRLLAPAALSRHDRRALAATIRNARTVVTPLLVGFE